MSTELLTVASVHCINLYSPWPIQYQEISKPGFLISVFLAGWLKASVWAERLGFAFILCSEEHVAAWNNIISKLAGTSSGCKSNTLRIWALALVYNADEYCAPAWWRSAYCKKINTQMNHTMRTISGTVKSTQTHWLPVLAHIAPTNFRRNLIIVIDWLFFGITKMVT